MASANQKELDECVRKNVPWSDIPIHLKQVSYECSAVVQVACCDVSLSIVVVVALHATLTSRRNVNKISCVYGQHLFSC